MSTDNISSGDKTAVVADFIARGDFESAIRLSGETLAYSDNALRLAVQDKCEIDNQLADFVSAALLHIHSLRVDKTHPAEAFLCSVGTLLSLEVYSAADKVSAADKMRLYFYAIQSAIDCFETLQFPETQETEDHCGYILSYLASLLYHYYQKASGNENNSQIVNEVYQFLYGIKDSGAIQTPTIRFGDKDLDPSSEAGPLLIDIISRAAALGLN